MTNLSATDLLLWNDTSATQWREHLALHPEALALPCDIRGSSTIADLLQHIVAVELRYADRLANDPITGYADVPKDTPANLFAIHDRAISKLQPLLADPTFDWDLELEMQTRSAGTLIATRRTILFHLLLHSMRHYAQLATLLRHANIPGPFDQDYLMLHARKA